MTPQLVLSQNDFTHAGHLSEDQFGELLTLSEADASSNPHLLTCDRCAAEFAAVRQSLSLFREASRAHAADELRRLPQVMLPSRRLISPALQPAWLLAAATLTLAALLPMQMRRLRTLHAPPAVAAMPSTAAAVSAESDEALLDDVDRESSASLPSPMQALASPSTSLAASTPLATQRPATQGPAQRKD